MEVLKVLLADDHELFLQGVRAVLEEIPQVRVIGTVNNGEKLISLLTEVKPSLILLDLNMPESDGLKALQIIKQQYATVKVLVLTNYSQPELMEEVERLGADGFLVKDSPAAVLKQAVLTIAGGGKHFAKLNPAVVLDESSYFFDDFLRKFKLTRREVDIIRLVCKEYSSRQIADLLHVSEFTVATHRKNIQRKLNIKNVAGLVSFAKEHQLVN